MSLMTKTAVTLAGMTTAAALALAPALPSGADAAPRTQPVASTAKAGDGIEALKFIHADKCADVPRGSGKLGLQLVQWKCGGANTNGSPNQWWRIKSAGNGNSWIMSTKTGKCMNVQRGSKAKGASVIQWHCNKQANTLWKVTKRGGNGGWQAKNVKSGLCLNVRGASKSDGAKLIQWTCDGKNNSRFWRID
ncbi:RICIN domain-containing protein [Streptomyces coeruleoprunus]|uniref:RICIN domain-containing protein n=1 Tax=Streptomyces coeruleoprunus TaxID=285563 RepID=A0ABV9X940_9ACTN